MDKTSDKTPELTRETARLVARVRDGDADAYEELFTRAGDRLLFFVELRLGRALRVRIGS